MPLVVAKIYDWSCNFIELDWNFEIMTMFYDRFSKVFFFTWVVSIHLIGFISPIWEKYLRWISPFGWFHYIRNDNIRKLHKISSSSRYKVALIYSLMKKINFEKSWIGVWCLGRKKKKKRKKLGMYLIEGMKKMEYKSRNLCDERNEESRMKKKKKNNKKKIRSRVCIRNTMINFWLIA